MIAGERPPLLSVRHLRVAFPTPSGPLLAVDGVSFDIAPREVLGVVGESGSGKSVTALSLMRLLPESARVDGSVAFNGVDVLGMPGAELQRLRGKHVSMIFQDPRTSLNPVRTVGAQLEETMRTHLGVSRRAARERAAELLGEVGIPDPRRHLDVYPHELSGGMCQRVMIAMALSCEPQLVLADEPTTALDVSVQAQILELLRTVIAKHGTALMMITHDLSVVAGLADRVAVMYAGEIVELAPSERLFTHPRHPYTASLLDCITRLDDVRTDTLPAIPGAPPDLTKPRASCPFAPRCSLAEPVCAEPPPLAEKAPGHAAACFFDIPAPAPRAVVAGAPEPEAAPDQSPGVVLDVRDLEVHFKRAGLHLRPRPPVRAVDGVSFEVRRGETLGLVGESGSGKSTAARAILQLVPLTGGEIRLDDETISGKREHALKPTKRRLQMVLQDPYGSLDPRMSIAEIVAEPLIVHDVARGREATRRATALLEIVGLPAHFADRMPDELSGGQRQRVNIARAIALNPECIVADEPTSALDVSVRAQILNLLRDIQLRNKLTYLFISHDLGVVRHMSDHVAVMYLGRLVEIGDRETIFGAPRHPYTRGLLEAVPVPDPVVERSRRRAPLTGEVPSAANPPQGCNFNTRCPFVFDRCFKEDPLLIRIGGTHLSACHLAAPQQVEMNPEPPVPATSVADHRRTES
jgi:peptide/nickel transport system ATP-binding protein